MESDLSRNASFSHILLEVYCTFLISEKDEDRKPGFCNYDIGHPGYHCLINKCKYFSFTSAEKELAYSGDYGEIMADISIRDMSDMFGPGIVNDLERKWEKICIAKIEEATNDLNNLLNSELIK